MSRYQIEVPEELRHVLANDWDLVVHQKYLFKVPAKVICSLSKNITFLNSSQVTVSNIIDQYVVHLESLDISPAKRSSATEVNLHIF